MLAETSRTPAFLFRARAFLRLAMIAAAAVPLMLLAACGGDSGSASGTPTDSDKLTVAVSLLPQAYFVERIGGEHVDVQVIVPPGASPATYEPTPDQMKALAKAAAYTSIGVPFEKTWLPKLQEASPNMTMVDTTAGVDLMQANGKTDPHIWLSPRRVAIQASTIHDALVELDPTHAADYDAGLASFTEDIEALDTSITTTLDSAPNKAFIVFHPAWSYFAKDYGLEMIPIEVGGTEPSPAELAEIIDTAEERQIRVVFAQPEFSTTQAEAIASSIGGEVLLISPLARDWLTNMTTVTDTFAKHLAA
jgi:zinc transport system substrate-binding protein